MRIGFQKRVLHGVFRIFPVAGDVHGKAKDLPLVAADQLLKRGSIAVLGCRHEKMLILPRDFRRQSMWISSAQSVIVGGYEFRPVRLRQYVSTDHGVPC